MRVSWFEDQWDTKYIQSAKDIILKIVSAYLKRLILANSCTDGSLPWQESVNGCNHITKC
jgi:hypothetical protein